MVIGWLIALIRLNGLIMVKAHGAERLAGCHPHGKEMILTCGKRLYVTPDLIRGLVALSSLANNQ
jgi:hypothetical protein